MRSDNYLCTAPATLDVSDRAALDAYLASRGKSISLADRIKAAPCHSVPDRIKLLVTWAPRYQLQIPVGCEVYVDGCCENGVMGVGVLCEQYGIEISETLPGRTNNVAECIAVIRALEELEARGIRRARIKCDSQLVVYWTSGRYSCRSRTATTYVPKIKELLARTHSSLVWIAGRNNLADPLSRRHQKFADDKPRKSFRYYLNLRSGRDDFSKLRLPQLEQMVSANDRATVADHFSNCPTYQATCLRWIVRGLAVGDAIRKVEVGRTVGRMARRSRHGNAYEE